MQHRRPLTGCLQHQRLISDGLFAVSVSHTSKAYFQQVGFRLDGTRLSGTCKVQMRTACRGCALAATLPPRGLVFPPKTARIKCAHGAHELLRAPA
eukprot:268603-Chlamydomonas_euryale.AAC.1